MFTEPGESDRVDTVTQEALGTSRDRSRGQFGVRLETVLAVTGAAGSLIGPTLGTLQVTSMIRPRDARSAKSGRYLTPPPGNAYRRRDVALDRTPDGWCPLPVRNMAQIVDGPYFEDLRIGQVHSDAPSFTLTEGAAAIHRSIVGGRIRATLDHQISAALAGPGGPLAPAGLVWDVAIGQSTVATHAVTANVFYRAVTFRRAPRIGDTLHTITEVVALRQNSPRPGRAPTGLAVLRITTTDQAGRPVLDFWRCAMLPLRDPDVDTGQSDDVSAVGGSDTDEDFATVTDAWDFTAYRKAVPGRHFGDLTEGESFDVKGGDVVSSAPELARLTLNVAKVHHDGDATSGRLVYGGHTIGIALHQAVRCLPTMVTVVGWHSCDHLAPVREGDTLRSTLDVERLAPLEEGGLAHLRSRVRSHRSTSDADVLDWRFVAVMA